MAKHAVSFLLIVLCVCTGIIAADGYSIESLSVDMVVTAEGVYEIREEAVLFFHQPLHGFYRSIPVEYHFGSDGLQDVRARVSSIRASDDLKITREGGYVLLRIGDADRTVTGRQRYVISYRYDIGSDRNNGFDEFYFNLLGDGWEVSVDAFDFSITFPKGIDAGRLWFNRGLYGSESSEGIAWSISADGLIVSGRSLSALMPGEAVTIRAEFPEGYFLERSDPREQVSRFNPIASFIAIGIAVLLWYLYGRDDDLIVVPRFYPPEGMSPMDVGYAIDGSLDAKDVTSMIFYWADKGCLTIVEHNRNFSFVRGKDPVDASAHEMQLFRAFFSRAKNGVVTIEDLQGKFHGEYIKIVAAVDRYFRGKRSLHDAKARNMAAFSALLSLIPAVGFALALTADYPGPATLAFGAAILGMAVAFGVLIHVMLRSWHIRSTIGKIAWIVMLGVMSLAGIGLLSIVSLIAWVDVSFALIESAKAVCAVLVITVFSALTGKRSSYGQKLLEEMLGFRDFINKVEMDKLKTMIDEDPQLYYHMLSFAIVMGLEKTWSKKFASITLEPPTWYMGNASVWNAMAVSSMLHRCNTALVTSVVSAPASAPGSKFGGSSFGGRGFSGGGFGGGGGGAW